MEKTVDYFPQILPKIPFSSLAKLGRLLLCGISPYISVENQGAALPFENRPIAPAALRAPKAFHNRL
ncbi:MAG TPA: hypothetical protein VN776_05605 [Terracidiphilus sp.]|nr:hypothetical protein [Terracidiphilus sp.]